jgi:uncharacterized membrane protein
MNAWGGDAAGLYWYVHSSPFVPFHTCASFVGPLGLCIFLHTLSFLNVIVDVNIIQLSTMDLLALASMKNAAKCDT